MWGHDERYRPGTDVGPHLHSYLDHSVRVVGSYVLARRLVIWTQTPEARSNYFTPPNICELGGVILGELHGEIYTYPGTTLDRASDLPPKGARKALFSVLFDFSGVVLIFESFGLIFRLSGRLSGNVLVLCG